MAKSDIISREEIDQMIEDMTNGITLPGVLQSLMNLVGTWLADAKRFKRVLDVAKWEAVQEKLTEAYRASVRRYDGLG